MSKPYLYERQTEYWTSRGIEDYFLDAGFEVITFPVSQLSERGVPFDFIFLETHTCKIFGIQYKALYGNGADHWPIDDIQYRNLQEFKKWGYYCLSEITTAREYKIAVHRSIFLPVDIPVRDSKIYRGRVNHIYYRWGGFVSGLEQCNVGLRIQNREQLEEAIKPINRPSNRDVDNHMLDIFLVNLEQQRLLHLDNK